MEVEVHKKNCLVTINVFQYLSVVHALGIFRPSVIVCKCFNKLIPRENFGIKDACVR